MRMLVMLDLCHLLVVLLMVLMLQFCSPTMMVMVIRRRFGRHRLVVRRRVVFGRFSVADFPTGTVREVRMRRRMMVAMAVAMSVVHRRRRWHIVATVRQMG